MESTLEKIYTYTISPLLLWQVSLFDLFLTSALDVEINLAEMNPTLSVLH